MKLKSSNGIVIALLLISLIGNAVLATMFMRTRSELATLKANPQQASQEEINALVAEVGQQVDLPDGVTPVLATVNDAAKLKSEQTFFEKAENGDKVLMYTNVANADDRKVYLYRPSTKQLINVAPINLQGQIQSFTDEFSIEVRNGTTVEGLEDKMEALLGQMFPNATLTGKSQANETYERSFLVNVSGNQDLAERLGELYNVQVQEMPAGESAETEAEYVLFLGGGEAVTQNTNASPSPSPAPSEE